jgi:hypothetical protein
MHGTMNLRDNVLVLLQDIYMFRVPAVPIIKSTALQLTVTGITDCNIKFLYKTRTFFHIQILINKDFWLSVV